MLPSMLIPIGDIINLPVETQSGRRLGKVQDAYVDVESQNIRQYSVAPSGISHLFGKGMLLIHRDQVLSITREKMVVEDSVGRAAEKEAQLAKNKPQFASEVVARQE